MLLIIRLRVPENSTTPRWSAFGISSLLHVGVVAAMTLWTVKPAAMVAHPVNPQYTVRFVHLQSPVQYWSTVADNAAMREKSDVREIASAANAKKRTKRVRPKRPSAAPAPVESAVAQERRFLLPPDIRKQPVTQTLVQLDVPPDVVLKQEIPLPNALSWTQTVPPPPAIKQIVAPPATKSPEVAKSLPAAPALEAPNRETQVANLNVAAAPVNDTPRLAHAPSVASPVSIPGPEQAKEIPQIAVANSTQPSATNLIALSNTPLHSTPVVVLPPANQIAPSDRANPGSAPTAGTGKSAQEPGEAGHAQLSLGTSDREPEKSKEREAAGQAKSPAVTAAAANPSAKAKSSSSPAPPVATLGTSARPRETAAVAPSESSSTAKTGTTPATGKSAVEASGPGRVEATAKAPENIPGVTRITQPRDGKFGVVVQASADPSRYPESAGALSGKVVYTVYVRVGLRKNWILQYCLPKSAVKTSSTPVDAPWPFEMLRPDRLTTIDPEYVMVKGMLSSTGQFEQLAMVFPENFETKDLLLTSLKGWAFRPASRDGEATAVEVLLIIPRQME